MGSGRSILEKVIKDDLSEEVTFELRFDRWGLACHDRQNSQRQDSVAGTSLACGMKLKKASAARNRGKLFREEAEETGGVNHRVIRPCSGVCIL